jgi:hypothetical protein
MPTSTLNTTPTANADQIKRLRLMPMAGLGIIIGLLCLRLFAAPMQIDWDEELYFLIARGWAHGQLPYRDIFDHKPPLVYAIYFAGTFGGASITALRVIYAGFMLLCCYTLAKALNPGKAAALAIPHTALLFGTATLWEGVSTNTETLYMPLLMLTAACLINADIFLASLCAALSLAIKYTTALDILGIVVFYLTRYRGKPGTTAQALSFSALTAGMTLLIYGTFYFYFRSNHVDLLDAILFTNFKHASDGGNPLLAKSGGFYKFFKVCAPLMLGGLVLAFWNNARKPLIAAVLVWASLSVLQGMLTKKYYYHYFIPALIPVVLMTGLDAKRELNRVFALIASAYILVVSGNYVYAQSQINVSIQSIYSPQCASINSGAYILDKYIRSYRDCGEEHFDKFVFPAFYTEAHFATLSQSEGIAGLQHKLASKAVPAVLMRSDNQLVIVTDPTKIPPRPNFN